MFIHVGRCTFPVDFPSFNAFQSRFVVSRLDLRQSRGNDNCSMGVSDFLWAFLLLFFQQVSDAFIVNFHDANLQKVTASVFPFFHKREYPLKSQMVQPISLSFLPFKRESLPRASLLRRKTLSRSTPHPFLQFYLSIGHDAQIEPIHK